MELSGGRDAAKALTRLDQGWRSAKQTIPLRSSIVANRGALFEHVPAAYCAYCLLLFRNLSSGCQFIYLEDGT